MTSKYTITLVDGVRVVVPKSLDLITPYVLLEQQDWFEDEIKFVRRLVTAGQQVIDIGANYGVYALSMARIVGPLGRVWAFEPASSTAQFLAESISINAFPQAILVQSALSDTSGNARLSLHQHSELNALVPAQASASVSETVPLVTLDECMDRYGWQRIDFMKIDAEGEEANILKGGQRFFSELSPLVQYEIKAGANLHLELVQDFAALGYTSYRLVPGLDLLIPFEAESQADKYLLNLFCCKQDRSEQLAAEGFLLPSVANLPSPTMKNYGEYAWRRTIAPLPYGAQLARRWEQTVASGKSAAVEEALCAYTISQDSKLSATERFGALDASFNRLRQLCVRQPSHLRLTTLARVARDYGARALAVNALQQLCDSIFRQNPTDLGEPFLPPGRRFDSIPPGNVIGNWILAAVLEELERLSSYSSFYTGVSARKRLELIRTLGFGDAEMERRLRLLQKRFRIPAS